MVIINKFKNLKYSKSIYTENPINKLINTCKKL